MRRTSFAIGAGLALALSVWMGNAALADDSAKAPTTGSTKPDLGKGPAEQKSLSSSAPPATATGTTGSTDQSKTVKTMNSNEKSKVDAAGK